MNRGEWKFSLPGSELAAKARACHEHHVARLAWWGEQLEEAKARLKAEGVEIREAPEMAAFAASTRSYAADMQVVVDPTLTRRITQCQGKVKEHQEARDEFDRWLRAFEQNPNARYDLDIDDMNYFRV